MVTETAADYRQESVRLGCEGGSIARTRASWPPGSGTMLEACDRESCKGCMMALYSLLFLVYVWLENSDVRQRPVIFIIVHAIPARRVKH